jgi:2-desacetyl-2-hydroxyethyl bacteriochlorophyllide A dehydrogenase
MQTHRVVFVARGRVELQPYDVPDAPAAGELLIETHFSTISPGTELAFLHAAPNTPGEYPFYAGYSASGRVLAVGAGVSGFAAGDLVAAWLHHAGAQCCEASRCVKIPSNLELLDASAYRIASISLQGVRKAQVQLGETVAVFGLGIIGNLAGQIARCAGATRVIGVDPVAWRRELAIRCGFDDVVASIEELRGQTAPVVIESTGIPAPVNDALAVAARLGRVILLGSTRGCTEQVNFYRDVHKKGLSIIGAHEMIRAEMEDVRSFCTPATDARTVIDLLAAKRIQTRALITDVMPARDAVRAYERLTSRAEQLMTIAFDWR